MVFFKCILAIMAWRMVSKLKPVDYEEIRQIVRDELRKDRKNKPKAE